MVLIHLSLYKTLPAAWYKDRLGLLGQIKFICLEQQLEVGTLIRCLVSG